jgi:hypothetical protein
MSGGSYNYAYHRLEEFSEEFGLRADTPARKAFAKHLQKVAKAMHDIEWVDSSDYGYGDEVEAIMACISKTELIEAAIERAEKAVKELTETIKSLKP